MGHDEVNTEYNRKGQKEKLLDHLIQNLCLFQNECMDI